MTIGKGFVRSLGTLALGAAMTLGALGVSSALGVQPVFAAGCPSGTSPASEGALQFWLYEAPPGGVGSGQVVFLYGSQQEILTIDSNFAPGGNLANVDQNWGGIDNPAPLLWYYSHESSTDLGCWAFPAGVTYSSTVISQMQQEKFAPSTVGGVNPSGLGAVTPPSSGGSGTSGSGTSGSGTSGSGTSGSTGGGGTNPPKSFTPLSPPKVVSTAPGPTQPVTPKNTDITPNKPIQPQNLAFAKPKKPVLPPKRSGFPVAFAVVVAVLALGVTFGLRYRRLHGSTAVRGNDVDSVNRKHGRR